FPALYSLAFRRLLPEKFLIVGVARTEESDDDFRERMKEAVQQFSRDEFRDDVWDTLTDGMRYIAADFSDHQELDRLATMTLELDEQRGTGGNRVYYLAIPPAAFDVTVREVGTHSRANGWRRLLVEQPFGHDLASAR